MILEKLKQFEIHGDTFIRLNSALNLIVAPKQKKMHFSQSSCTARVRENILNTYMDEINLCKSSNTTSAMHIKRKAIHNRIWFSNAVESKTNRKKKITQKSNAIDYDKTTIICPKY